MKNALHLSSLALSWLPVMYLTIFSTSLIAGDSAEHFNTCNRSPVITCPQNFFGCLGDDTSPASVGSATAVAGEDDCEVPVVSFEDEVEGADACAGGILIKRTWRAEYPNGADPWLFAECTQVILLEDDELPLITDCPTNIVVNPDNGTSATVAWAPPFASDDCGIVFFESNFANGSVFPTGVTTVIYTARDACGNESTCSFTVTVSATGCQDIPSISCPPNFTGCVGQNIDPAFTGTPTASFADAACGTPIVTFRDVVISTGGSCAQNRTIERTWTATNSANSNLSASCVQLITIEDNQAPVITTCQEDVEHSTISPSGIVIIFDDPIVSDDCGIASIVPSIPSGSVFTPGVTSVSFTITDLCGNVATCSFDITVILVQCQDPPVLDCPDTFQGCIGSGTDPSITGMATATFSSSTCMTVPDVTFSDEVISTGPCAGAMVIQRTWTATNPDDLTMTSSCVQTINIGDQTVPTIVTCPQDIVVGSTSTSGMVVNFPNVVATDDCGVASVTYSRQSGSVFPLGTTTVVVTVTDACGNSNTCFFSVQVLFNQACQESPSINCPANISLCVGESTDPAFTGRATASFSSNNCSSDAIITFSDQVVATGTCASARTIQRTWTATNPDNSVLTSSCTQVITIDDTQAPVISQCPADITQTTSSPSGIVVMFSQPVVSDDCGIASSSFSKPSGSVFLPGVTTVTFTVTDLCGRVSTCSFTVTVTMAGCQGTPSITCIADFVGCPGSSIMPSVTGTAIGTGSGCLVNPTVTFADQVISTGPCSGAQVIERTWTAANPDDSNQSVSCTQRITLVDTQAPTITNCPSNATISSSQPTYSWAMPTVSDNCGGTTITANVANGSTFPIGTTTVVLTATDGCGNNTSCSFTVTVVQAGCQATPSISCPADFTGCPGTSTSPSVTGMASASYGSATGCPASPNVTFSDQMVSRGPCSGAVVINRIWRATNPDNGQSATCTQRITLVDTQAPTLTNCPASVTISSDQATYTWTSPTVTDNCGGNITLNSNVANGSTFPIGTTTVVLTATDACGNSSTCSFTVTVVQAGCQATPTINCPANYTACPGTSIDPSVTGRATGSFGSASGCPSSPTISFSDQIVSQGPCSGAVTINRVWTASNPDNGQSVTCTQRITLVDTQAPTLTNCPASITISSNQAAYTWTSPTVTDNCGGTITLNSNVANGSTFPIGSTTVTLTARDNCGNSSSCSFVVTVEEETTTGGGTGGGGSGSGSLSVTCPSDVVMACDDNSTGSVPRPEVSSTCDLCTGGDISGFLFIGNFRGTNYYLSRYKFTWPQARAGAASIGGFLAKIESAEENQFLASRLPVNSAYIGLNDEAQEGTFRWTDGDAPSYTNWYPRQPNDYKGNQDYVELLNNGLWNDQFNYEKLLYIVEIPCVSVRQTAGPTTLKDLSQSTRVEFEVTDACGNVETCSFNIEVEQRFSVVCPDDIAVETSTNGAYVSYDLPEVTTCCTVGNAQPRSIPGFVYMGSHGGSYYYCSRSNATWSQANANCRSLGGYLATIESPAENNFLASQLITQTAFVGISDHITEGRFFNVNNRQINYSSWGANQPSNTSGNQHFVEMNPYGLWNDVSAEAQREYIMEVPASVRFTLVEGLPSGAAFPVGTTRVTVRATDACGVSETCSFNVTVSNPNTGGNTVCRSFAQRSDLGYIKETKVGNLLFQSGNNGGFADLTEYCLNVNEGGEFEVILTPGFGSQAYLAYYHFYIDYNGDGDFDDTRELIGTARSSHVVAGTFPVPIGTKNGNIRMRIVMSLNGFPSSPCDVIGFGEVEDYCLNVRGYRGEAFAQGRSEIGPIELQGQGGIETGIDFNQRDIEDLKLTISPNPVSHMMTIGYNANNVAEAQIINLKGQVVQMIDDLSRRIDVSDYSSGMYLLRIMHEDGTSKVEKFIVE